MGLDAISANSTSLSRLRAMPDLAAPQGFEDSLLALAGAGSEPGADNGLLLANNYKLTPASGLIGTSIKLPGFPDAVKTYAVFRQELSPPGLFLAMPVEGMTRETQIEMMVTTINALMTGNTGSLTSFPQAQIRDMASRAVDALDVIFKKRSIGPAGQSITPQLVMYVDPQTVGDAFQRILALAGAYGVNPDVPGAPAPGFEQRFQQLVQARPDLVGPFDPKQFEIGAGVAIAATPTSQTVIDPATGKPVLDPTTGKAAKEGVPFLAPFFNIRWNLATGDPGLTAGAVVASIRGPGFTKFIPVNLGTSARIMIEYREGGPTIQTPSGSVYKVDGLAGDILDFFGDLAGLRLLPGDSGAGTPALQPTANWDYFVADYITGGRNYPQQASFLDNILKIPDASDRQAVFDAYVSTPGVDPVLLIRLLTRGAQTQQVGPSNNAQSFDPLFPDEDEIIITGPVTPERILINSNPITKVLSNILSDHLFPIIFPRGGAYFPALYIGLNEVSDSRSIDGALRTMRRSLTDDDFQVRMQRLASDLVDNGLFRLDFGSAAVRAAIDAEINRRVTDKLPLRRSPNEGAPLGEAEIETIYRLFQDLKSDGGSIDPVLVASGLSSEDLLRLLGGTGLSAESEALIKLAEEMSRAEMQQQQTPPIEQEIAKALGQIATYLGFVNSLVSKIDPKLGAEIGKAVALANAGNLLLSAMSGDPRIASGKMDDAIMAVFNAAANFSPEIAQLAPYVNTAKQAADVIFGLTTPIPVNPTAGLLQPTPNTFYINNVSGFSAAGDIAALASAITGLVNAPPQLTQALTAASLLFRGVTLFNTLGATAGAMTVPFVGWAVGVVTFVLGLILGNKEKWSNWKTVMSNVSVDGGQGPDGRVLMDDYVRQKVSSKKRNRMEYVGDAAQTPLLNASFSLRPETVLQNDPNSTIVVGRGSSGRSAYADVQLADGRSARLYARGTDENTGERIWAGSNGDDGWISLTESQFAPQVEAPTGDYILDLSAGFHAINPEVKPTSKSQSFVISAAQAAELSAAFGAEQGSVPFTDGRIELFRPFVNQMGEIRYRTDHTSANIWTYDDFNMDGVPDLLRQGVLQGLRAHADGKYEVKLNEHRGSPAFSYKADSMEEAYHVGARVNVLMMFLAGRPDLYDLYFSDPQDNASGNIVLIYRYARDTGVLPLLDELITLAGPPEGETLMEQLMDLAARGVRIEEIRNQLGMVVDPSHLNSYADLAQAFGGNTLRLLDHYVRHGNGEGRAVNGEGQVLTRWQPPADGWSDLAALAYLATYRDLMDVFGPNPEAARAHWNASGRWEGRGIGFDVDGYLASRPDLRAAALATLTVTPQAVIRGPAGRYGGLNVTLPEIGTVMLQNRGANDDGERIYGYSYDDNYYMLTQSQLDAMTAARAPDEDQIRQFALQHYIAAGRYEMAAA